MKYRCCIKDTSISADAMRWCYSKMGTWWDGRWSRWYEGSTYVFFFRDEEDYLYFTLMFSEAITKDTK